MYDDRTWYVILAAPPKYFDGAREEFGQILKSLQFIEEEEKDEGEGKKEMPPEKPAEDTGNSPEDSGPEDSGPEDSGK